jgi:hypothetical protein
MLVALLSLLAPSADACGGLFCNSSAPTMQSAERILFAIDEDAQEVEVHVGITYTGESKDFSWVVPVPGEPELFPSTDQLWSGIYFPTNPTYTMATVIEGDCKSPSRGGLFGGGADFAAPAEATFTSSSGGVSVLAQQAVGPYDTVTLAADSSDALTTWLTDNGYDLPPGLEPVLAPYVAAGQNFVALRLLPGMTSGDIAPLGMRYPGTQASIPIQLTSIAAQPNTRLEVYVLGDARAVPLSYLHVIPNDMAYDWFTQSVLYDDVVTLAADEAGGHAFATDFSGSTDVLAGAVYVEGTYPLEEMRTMDVDSWLATAYLPSYNQSYGYYGYYAASTPIDANLLAVMELVLPEPESLVAQGVPETAYWACPECYVQGAALSFDPVAATDAFESGFVDPLRNAQGVLDRFPHITRLTSSLDAREMTVDPLFGFNSDMEQDSSNLHNATLTYDCASRRTTFDDADRELEFPDGSVVSLPSESWFADHHETEYEYLSSLAAYNAAVIEQTGESGEPVVVSDERGALADLVDALNGSFAQEFGGGCGGCDGTGAPMAPALIGLAGFLARRRVRGTEEKAG